MGQYVLYFSLQKTKEVFMTEFKFTRENLEKYIGGEFECKTSTAIIRNLIKDFPAAFDENLIGIHFAWTAMSEDKGSTFFVHFNVETLDYLNDEEFSFID